MDRRRTYSAHAARIDHFEAVVRAPCAQHIFLRLGFKTVPLVEFAFAIKKVLEACVSAFAPEHAVNFVAVFGQKFCDKTLHQISTEIEFIFVRQHHITIRGFEIIRTILLHFHVVILGRPVDFTGIECNVSLVATQPAVADPHQRGLKIIVINNSHARHPMP